MDCFGNKKRSKKCEKQLRALSEKVRVLEEEIKAITCETEKESKAYERDGVVFAMKEAEWKQEKKKLKEEVKRLRKLLDEKMGEKEDKKFSFSFTSSSFLMEQMEEERTRRDEAVEKWKKLYLAIKIELDDLMERTHAGYGLYKEEEMIEQLKMDVKCKDKTIEELKAKLSAAEHEEYKKAREFMTY